MLIKRAESRNLAQPSEKVATSEQPSHQTSPQSSEHFIPRNWGEAIPLIVWVVFVLAFGFVFAEAIGALIPNPWWRAALGLGAVVVLTALLIHWRQIRQSLPLAYAFGVLLVVIVFSPTVRQWWSSVEPPELPPASLNPLYDIKAQWTLTQNLAKSPSRHNCYIMVARYPTPYSEELSRDLIAVLDVLDWKHYEYLSNSPLVPGFSVRSDETGPSRECADALFRILNGSGLKWSKLSHSGNFPTAQDFFPKPRPLNDCGAGESPCVRLGVGNEPGND